MINVGVKTTGKDKRPEIHIKSDPLLRETTAHYIRQIGDADRKARIMLVVNSILLTIGLTVITKVIHTLPWMWIPATVMIASNLCSLFFSVLSVRPEPRRMAKESEDNILHYSQCSQHSLGDYSKIMIDTVHNENRKTEAVLKELYFYGNLLTTKYKVIKIAYRFFYWGLALSVISYLFFLMMT